MVATVIVVTTTGIVVTTVTEVVVTEGDHEGDQLRKRIPFDLSSSIFKILRWKSPRGSFLKKCLCRRGSFSRN
jgi:hypothetical protein